MFLSWLDHVNIRTANLSAMTRFYADVLGLEPGPRPPFSFNGAWLYCGERAVVHLVETRSPPAAHQPSIEHFAFRAKGLPGFLDRLKAHEVRYRIAIVPQLELRQVNIADPDGNHIEIAFASDEALDAEPEVK